jgi:hypothetical protein
MAFFDDFPDYMKKELRKYPTYAWQVEQCLAVGWSWEQILEAIKQENKTT